MGQFHTENPVSFEVLKEYDYATDSEIERKLTLHQQRVKEWRYVSPENRAVQLKMLAAKLREKREAFAFQMALEMGKPVKQGREEVDKCALACEHYAGKLKELLASREVVLDQKKARLVKEPLGSIFAVMPWNFPLWQVMRSLAPIVGGGNGYILKHAEIVAGTADMIEAVCDEVFGPGLVISFHLNHDQAAKLIEDGRIHGVTMTGSSRGGSEVAKVAGMALKKCVLELGGSDAYLVLDDADIMEAARISAKARLINSGQSCVAAKRFIVPRIQFQKFWSALAEEMDRAVVGLPQDDKTEIGPMAHRKFAEQLRIQQEKILKDGAKLLWTKDSKEPRGAYVSPAVILASPLQESYSKEEFFGPVALVTPYDDLDEGIEIANHSRYGLGAAVFSSNLARAENVASRLEAGVVAINTNVRSDPRVPFGGIKDSGFGRELGDLGFQEFLNQKTLLL